MDRELHIHFHVFFGRWYGPELATFEESCRKLMGSFNTLLPEGSLNARVRYTTRESKHLKEGSIGETLGDEATGMVQSICTESTLVLDRPVLPTQNDCND
jgi:hypothetical protein